MSDSLPKAYEPDPVENKWYSFWEDKGFFSANSNSKKTPYTIVLPPPNVTGVLHMGHALVDTIQDILIRWKRMCGYEALWIPGTDHAGISTQTVVERHLMAQTGKRRKDFSREEFLAHVWDWKEKSEGHIIAQLKKVGCSCDWSRLRFTMDERANGSVKTMFKKLYDAGLIYQGDYLVNWDPITQTALADDEVEHEEKASSLWFFSYPLEGSAETISIATTRPETMLGDTAVAVSQSDERYAHLIGKHIKLPIMGRLIPIIADHHVNPEFGTGAVKITPAHDPNDYEMGIRHNLPMINIMTPDGKINEAGGAFAGLSMEEARAAVVSKMKELGHLEKIEPHTHRVGVSYRSKAVIEPFLSKQWFVKMTAFKSKLIEAVKHDKVQLYPEYWKKTYFHWIENLRDWCISRQLWWGHRIPIWKKINDPDTIICYAGEGLPPEVEQDPDLWEQDEDVLDTWFSSALWPFSTLGWPDKTEDLSKFYPTAILVTGHDILFFWVARMIMMGEYALDEVPFDETFIHGLIYGKSYWRKNGDAIAYVSPEERIKFELGDPVPSDVESKWEKMSKSKGNVIDPIEIISDFGADAMRMTLCSHVTQARQIDLDRRRFEEYKNFINKIWNGARFIFQHLPDTLHAGLETDALTLEDKWILSRLNKAIQDANATLKEFAFDRFATTCYEFFWNDFCAYYLELSKPTLYDKAGTPAQKQNKQQILLIVLVASLRIMHPVIPFITEELFSHCKKKYPHLKEIGTDPYTEELIEALQSKACIVAPYPKVIRKEDLDESIEETFAKVREIIYKIRNIRAEMAIPPGLAIDIYFSGEISLAKEHTPMIRSLLKISEIHYDAKTIPAFSSTAVLDQLTIHIPMPIELKEKEKLRLQKEQGKIESQLASLEKQLSNENFVSKAPPELVASKKEQLSSLQTKLSETTKKLSNLQN